jgi:predicted MFS family arabinose efflux permease
MPGGSLRRNREFMLLWSGQTLSTLGSQVSQVAYPLLVLAVTGSPSKAGIVGLARSVPIALFALPGGALADRVDRKWVMVACDGVRAAALVVLAIVLATGALPFGLIIAVAFVDGTGFIVSYVTERGALRQLVTPDQLPEAVARNESRTFAAMLAGPPLGGLLFGIARALPFVFDAVSYAASTLSMLLIRSDFQEPRDEDAYGDLREGLRWLWARPFFRFCSLLFAASNPVFNGVYLLVVVLARRHGASPALVGAMLGIAAAGGLAGALLAPTLQRRFSPRTVVISETWALAVALPLLLLVHDALLLGAIVAAAELITPVTNSIVVSARVGLAPDRLQGRIQAASTLVSFSVGWVGPLLAGVMIDAFGATATIAAISGWALLLAVIASIAPALRHAPTAELSHAV